MRKACRLLLAWLAVLVLTLSSALPGFAQTAVELTDPRTGERTVVEDTDGDQCPDRLTRYDRDGNIIEQRVLQPQRTRAEATDPRTGETTIWEDTDGDGRFDTETKKDRDGKVTGPFNLGPGRIRAEATDPETGETNTAEDTDGDGKVDTVTRRDRNGRVLEVRQVVQPARARAEATDPETGETTIWEDTDGDGRFDREIKKDKDGNVIRQRNLRPGRMRAEAPDPRTGETTIWEDTDGDGRFDRETKRDRNGNVIRQRDLRPGTASIEMVNVKTGEQAVGEDSDGDGCLDRVIRYGQDGQMIGAQSVLLGSPGTMGVHWAVLRLRRFEIVQGDEQGRLHLEKPITRAEMIKVIITAAGMGDMAAELQGTKPFSDTNGHWANGYIAIAKELGVTNGYPDGTFRPQAEVTYAEALTLAMRLAGVAPAAGAWPGSYIQAALDADLVPADLDLTRVGGIPAVRGAAFVLADLAFRRQVDGSSHYEREFDGW